MKKHKWDSNNISDQQGKTAIVTGATSGIGLETARVLAVKGAAVVMAVRNTAKGEAAAAKIKGENGNVTITVMEMDLANLASVRRFAESFTETHSRLDLLINNAGVMIPPLTRTTDGFELQFGTNHLGHFALTGHLIGILQRTPGSRVVNVSSMAHKFGSTDFDDLNWEKRNYKKWQAYGASKIANLYFTYELQRRCGNGNGGVTVVAAHPGWTATNLQKNMGFSSMLNSLFAQNTTMGALPTLYAATAPDVKGGDYFGPGGFGEMKGYPKKVASTAASHDLEIAAQLWQESEALTGVNF